MNYSRLTTKLLTILGTVATISIASATTLYQNALPTIALNGNPAVNETRSNASVIGSNYGAGSGYLAGDAFYFAGSGYNRVDSITIYEMSNGIAGTSNAPSTEFSNLTLYYGLDGSALTNSKVLSTVAQIDAASTQVKYNGVTDYQSLYSTAFYSIYAITFSNLNWIVNTGVYYDFAVKGVGIGGNSLALSVSDPNHSGAQEDQQLGQFLFFFNVASPIISAASSAPGCTPSSTCPTIANFSHPANLNFLIDGQTGVPEPSSFGLLAMGMGVLGMRLRRKS